MLADHLRLTDMEIPVWSDSKVPNDVIICLQVPVRLDWTFDKKTDKDADTSQTGGFALGLRTAGCLTCHLTAS